MFADFWLEFVNLVAFRGVPFGTIWSLFAERNLSEPFGFRSRSQSAASNFRLASI